MTTILPRRRAFVGNTFPKGVKSLTFAGSPDVGNTD